MVASFRDHITFGSFVGAAGAAYLYAYAIVTDPVLLVVLCMATVIGAFLPDLDHDTGTPFYIVFGGFTICCGAIALYYTLSHPTNLYILVGVPITTLVFVWFVIGTLFKHHTRHRGMMHSVPTLLISALVVFLVAKYLGQGESMSALFAAATGAGFLSHLILDEFHSENMFDGNPFENKRSLGTALKLFSSSKGITLFTYLILATLAYQALK